MRYLNAAEAARALGVGEKSVRRWLKAGDKFPSATIRRNGEYAIPEAEVEALRLQRLEDASPDSGQDTLQSRIADLEQRIATLEQTIAKLGRAAPSESVDVAKNKPVSEETGKDTRVPPKSPEITNTEARNSLPAELPPGTLSASDFAARHDIKYEDFKNMMRRGVSGERLEITEVPHYSRVGYSHKYLTPAQQEKAIEILRRHGKL